ncbi:PspC domain-containing protein [Sphingomonas phyllosphaerae]|uniref:PspC domain-containing protein n=1 Tax=Sphingomonas phyllosphaerae TaxID=257003 RepID=UPI0003F8E286|nr:PspC domain-containing protein [Sphingomonas phyllosphaerae]
MTDHTTTLVAAPRDNLFGVCAALGEDFGFNPLWLRLGFAVALLFSLEKVLLAYVALGVLVLVSRLLFPNRRRAVATDVPATAANEADEEEYRQAA